MNESKAKTYQIGDEHLSVSQIAKRAKTSPQTIRARLANGVTGDDLLVPTLRDSAKSAWALFDQRWSEWIAYNDLTPRHELLKARGLLPSGARPDWIKGPRP